MSASIGFLVCTCTLTHNNKRCLLKQKRREGNRRKERRERGREGGREGGRNEGCVSVLPRYTRAYQLNNMLFYIHEHSMDHTSLKMAGLDVIQRIHCRGMYTF